MSDAVHTHTNRLAGETSPYLLQHAHNPVDWYPWGSEALARARDENKPILLSVGYAACHWCHVMERESFENEGIARQMNENFVCIKVDREERPDVDAIYMAAVQAMSGRGGWPMTVFLTPDGRPFFGGTYYPPEDRQGMPGFPRVLAAVMQAYRERPNDVQKNAETLIEHMANTQALVAQEAGALSTAQLDRAAQALADQYDARFGGFGGAPKFPPAMALEFLLRCWKRTDDGQALQMVEGTLRAMAAGGMYDQIGGGFHRYSVDQYWLVPHFEKMLYDNALLARVYLLAFQATGEPRYRRTVEETLDWTLREMTHARGGFYSTLDADSEGEEGKFYVWTPQEVLDVLGPEAGPRFCRFYDVSERGNFEGKNILHESLTLASAGEAFGLPESEVVAELARSRQALLAARSGRVRPGLDDKVLAAWNGLMLRALAEAARTLDRDDYLHAAERNAEFVLTAMRRGGRLLRSWRDTGDGRGEAKLAGYLEDHAAYADGLLALYEATFEPRWLSEARALADTLIEAFWDEQAGVFYDTAADGEPLVVRPRDTFDNATPSGVSLACDVLQRLAALTGEQRYADYARRAMKPLAEIAAKYPTGFGRMLCAIDWALAEIKEVAIIGPATDPATASLTRALFGPYLPHMVAAGAAPGDQDAVQATPLLEERGLVDGRAAAYVCTGFACQAPVTEPAALLVELDAG